MSEEKKYRGTLYILRGLPGSGKTTLAYRLIGDSGVMYAADDYYYDDEGVYRWDPSKIGAAHSQCQRRVKEALELGVPVVVVHNTNTMRKEMKPYLDMAKENDYMVNVVSVFDGGLTDEQLAARNSHNVPVEAISKMRKRFEHDWKKRQNK